MVTNSARTHLNGNKEKAMGLDWLHGPEPTSSITKQAISWNPQGKRKRERPRNCWRHNLIADIGEVGYSCEEKDLRCWRSFVGGLYPGTCKGLSKYIHKTLSSLVYTILFYFDWIFETSNVWLCKASSNPFLEPTSTKQWV